MSEWSHFGSGVTNPTLHGASRSHAGISEREIFRVSGCQQGTRRVGKSLRNRRRLVSRIELDPWPWNAITIASLFPESGDRRTRQRWSGSGSSFTRMSSCRSPIAGEGSGRLRGATMLLDGQERNVAMFVMALPYSGAIFLQACPRECTEAFLEGLLPHLEGCSQEPPASSIIRRPPCVTTPLLNYLGFSGDAIGPDANHTCHVDVAKSRTIGSSSPRRSTRFLASSRHHAALRIETQTATQSLG